MRVTALLASRNRRESTLRSLDAFFTQEVPSNIELAAVLVDDGSTDGTASAVRTRWPAMKVLCQRGDLFWARSMAKAEDAALRTRPDFLLWLNDDVVLDTDAVVRLLSVANKNGEPCLVVGAVRDPESGSITYSGLRKRGVHPLGVERVEPQGRPVVVMSFNGNVVLVPRRAGVLIGTIDGDFEHAMADLDYGLRAVRAGVDVLLAAESVGTCRDNTSGRAWLDPALSSSDRIRALFGPKGIPVRSLTRFLRRHAGPTWPFWWGATYAKHVPHALVAGVRRPGSPGDTPPASLRVER